MYRVCGLGPNFLGRVVTEKNFYLRLAVEKMDPFVVFNGTYICSYVCSNSKFTPTVNYTNPKPEILSETIKIQIIVYKTDFFISLLVINLIVHSYLTSL